MVVRALRAKAPPRSLPFGSGTRTYSHAGADAPAKGPSTGPPSATGEGAITIARLLGYLFRVIARFTPGEAGRELDQVGAELVRLEQHPPHAAATSR